MNIEKSRKLFNSVWFQFLIWIVLEIILIIIVYKVPKELHNITILNRPVKRYFISIGTILLFSMFWFCSWKIKLRNQPDVYENDPYLFKQVDQELQKNFIATYSIKSQNSIEYFIEGNILLYMILNIIFFFIGKNWSLTDYLLINTILFLLVLALYTFVDSMMTPYLISYEFHRKDKYFWLKVWNYLDYRNEFLESAKNGKMISKLDIFLRNTDSINIKELKNVKENISLLSIEDLILLTIMAEVPTQNSFFETPLEIFSKTTIDFAKIISIFTTIFTIVFKLIELIIRNQKNIETSSFLVGSLIVMLILSPFIIFGILTFNIFTFKKKRKQIEKILIKLIDEEIIAKTTQKLI